MRLRPTSVPKSIQRPGALAEAMREGIREGLRDAGRMAVTEVRAAIATSSPRAPVNTGAMTQGIVASEPRAMGASFVVEVGPAPPVAVRAAVMEKGRRPGGRWPPRDALERWVRQKNLSDEGRFRKGRAVRTKGWQSRARSIAFLIARSIVRKGIAARRFFARAEGPVRAKVGPLVAAGISRALRDRGLA